MAVQTLTHTFLAVVGSGGTASANLTIDADNIAVLFVKIEPSIMGGTADFEIFQKDTLLAADLSYKATLFSGDFFDPVEDIAGDPVERTEGLVTMYQDDDATLELHIKVTNDDSSTKDFTITVRYVTFAGVGALDDLTDVVITAVATGEVLKYNGTNWINNTLAEAGIAPVPPRATGSVPAFISEAL